MQLDLSILEFKILTRWALDSIYKGHYGSSFLIIQEEENLIQKILNCENEMLDLSSLDLRVVFMWSESALGSSLKGSIQEEISLVSKLKQMKKEMHRRT